MTPLPPMPQCYVLVAKPGVHVSTKFVYGNLRADEITTHPDIDGQVEPCGRMTWRMAARMGNVLRQ